MERLDLSLKKFNLVFTNTLKKLDILKEDFNMFEQEVNYDNSISLYYLIENFNKMFNCFKKEYASLDKFDLGEYIKIKNYGSADENSFRVLSIVVDQPKLDYIEHAVFYFVDEYGQIKSYITNDINPYDPKYYLREIDLNKNKVKKYLDLFGKYEILLYLYNHFKDEAVFSDGTYSIYSKITSENKEFLDDLDSFNIILRASNYMKPSDTINISVKLGNELSINTSSSKLELEDEVIPANENDYLDILKRVYFNEKYLNSYWDRVDNIEVVNSKILSRVSDNIR